MKITITCYGIINEMDMFATYDLVENAKEDGKHCTMIFPEDLTGVIGRNDGAVVIWEGNKLTLYQDIVDEFVKILEVQYPHNVSRSMDIVN